MANAAKTPVETFIAIKLHLNAVMVYTESDLSLMKRRINCCRTQNMTLTGLMLEYCCARKLSVPFSFFCAAGPQFRGNFLLCATLSFFSLEQSGGGVKASNLFFFFFEYPSTSLYLSP